MKLERGQATLPDLKIDRVDLFACEMNGDGPLMD